MPNGESFVILIWSSHIVICHHFINGIASYMAWVMIAGIDTRNITYYTHYTG